MALKAATVGNPDGLTKTEIKVTCLDALGYSKWEISYKLQRAYQTIDSHIQRTHDKTHRNRSSQLAHYALKLYWINPDLEEEARQEIQSKTFQAKVSQWKLVEYNRRRANRQRKGKLEFVLAG